MWFTANAPNKVHSSLADIFRSQYICLYIYKVWLYPFHYFQLLPSVRLSSCNENTSLSHHRNILLLILRILRWCFITFLYKDDWTRTEPWTRNVYTVVYSGSIFTMLSCHVAERSMKPYKHLWSIDIELNFCCIDEIVS